MLESKYDKVKLFIVNSLMFFFFYVTFSNLASYMQFNLFANETEFNYVEESKQLNHYFNFKINKIIPNEKQYYLVINTNCCKICANSGLEKIINLEFKDNVTLILSGDVEVNSNIINKTIKEVIYDKKGNFFNFDISPLNDCLLEVENQAITNIIQFGKVFENQKLKSALKKY